ncbi:phosphonate ABC transporter ATP-binding protein [Virgibacillus kekensis]|uniref:Phosphonate ABC transporter ATP-binding protein n=1 Tax=Virgibacillus kekensis TaxID=202261 RepID=A0ABV9DLT1_9BACI
MIELHDVSVRYPGANTDALSIKSLSFKQGDFICVLGKSGAGKSTFIRCLNGLQRPSSGEIYLADNQITAISTGELRKARREMGMIFQHFNLIPRLTVMQNVLTGTFGYRSSFKNLIGWFSRDEIEQAKQIISDVGLSEMANRKVENLSGGQKQRVGIARAMLQQPKVMLGDEPVSSLDPGTSSHIFKLLKELHLRLGLLTVINVHDVELARRFATRIIALKDGKVIFDSIPEHFSTEAYRKTYES